MVIEKFRLMTKKRNKRSSEIFRHKLGFEGPTNLFLKQASKSLIRLWGKCFIVSGGSEGMDATV